MKKITTLLFSVFTIFSFTLLSAQKEIPIHEKIDKHSCGTDFLHYELLKSDPDYQRKFDRMNQDYVDFAKTNSQQFNLKSGAINNTTGSPVLPIVFHFVGAAPFSEVELEAIVADLNAKYSGNGALLCDSTIDDTDTDIQFCLAQINTNSNEIDYSSNTYTYGLPGPLPPDINSASVVSDSVQSTGLFPPTEYINVYVVNQIAGVAGFATLPSSHGASFDGIYMARGFLQPFTSVLTHEVGHYLGLFHTFGICDPFNNIDTIGIVDTIYDTTVFPTDTILVMDYIFIDSTIAYDCSCTNDNCLFDGDMICDTPPNKRSIQGCGVNTCNTDSSAIIFDNLMPLTDVIDDKTNYMDYDNPTKSHFTQGQAIRMQSMVDAIIGPRNSLLNSTACNAACAIPVDCNVQIIDTISDVNLFGTVYQNTIFIDDNDTVSLMFTADLSNCDLLDAYNWQVINLDSASSLDYTLTYTLLDDVNPSSGTLIFNTDGSFNFTPLTGFTGIATFSYQVCDNDIPSLCDTSTVTITVSAPGNNNGFALNDDQFNNSADNGSFDVCLSCNDNLFNPNVFGIFNFVGNSTFTDNGDGTVKINPSALDTEITFDYFSCDSFFNGMNTVFICDTASVVINLLTEDLSCVPSISPIAVDGYYFISNTETLDNDVSGNDFSPSPYILGSLSNDTLIANFTETGTYRIIFTASICGLDPSCCITDIYEFEILNQADSPQASCPDNISLGDGTFNNWTSVSGDITAPITIVDDIPSNYGFEIYSGGTIPATDENFGNLSFPTGVSDVVRVGPAINEIDSLAQGQSYLLQYSFTPTDENSMVNLWFLGMYHNNASMHVYCSYNTPPSPNLLNNNYYLNPPNSNTTTSSISPSSNSWNYPANDFRSNSNALLFNTTSFTNTTKIIEGETFTYNQQDNWDVINMDFSEFVCSNTEVTISIRCQTDMATGNTGKRHAYGYFGIESCLPGQSSPFELELPNISLNCQSYTESETDSASCIIIDLPEPPLYPFIPNSLHASYYNSIMGRVPALSLDYSDDGINYTPLSGSSSNIEYFQRVRGAYDANLGTRDLQLKICLLADEVTSNKSFAINYKTLCQEYVDTFNIFYGFFDEPDPCDSVPNGGEYLESCIITQRDSIFASTDSSVLGNMDTMVVIDTTLLTTSDTIRVCNLENNIILKMDTPCWAVSGQNLTYQWQYFSGFSWVDINGENNESLTLTASNNNLLNTYCRSFRRVTEYEEPFCERTLDFASDTVVIVNRLPSTVFTNEVREVNAPCENEHLVLLIRSIGNDNTTPLSCDPNFYNTLDSTDFNPDSLRIRFTDNNSNDITSSIDVSLSDSLYLLLDSGVLRRHDSLYFYFNPGTFEDGDFFRMYVDVYALGCVNTNIYVFQQQVTITPLNAGEIEHSDSICFGSQPATTLIIDNIGFINTGSDSQGYQWEFSYNADFSDSTVVAGATDPNAFIANSNDFNPLEDTVYIRRVYFGNSLCTGPAYSNIAVVVNTCFDDLCDDFDPIVEYYSKGDLCSDSTLEGSAWLTLDGQILDNSNYTFLWSHNLSTDSIANFTLNDLPLNVIVNDIINNCIDTVSFNIECDTTDCFELFLDSVFCANGTNTPELCDDEWTFWIHTVEISAPGTFVDIYVDGVYITSTSYNSIKQVGFFNHELFPNTVEVTVVDNIDTTCFQTLFVTPPPLGFCSPTCAGFDFINYSTQCSGDTMIICYDVVGTNNQCWMSSIKILDDNTHHGIPASSGIGDQTNVCDTFYGLELDGIQAYNDDFVFLWGMICDAYNNDDCPSYPGYSECIIDVLVPYSCCIDSGITVEFECNYPNATLTAYLNGELINPNDYEIQWQVADMMFPPSVNPLTVINEFGSTYSLSIENEFGESILCDGPITGIIECIEPCPEICIECCDLFGPCDCDELEPDELLYVWATDCNGFVYSNPDYNILWSNGSQSTITQVNPFEEISVTVWDDQDSCILMDTFAFLCCDSPFVEIIPNCTDPCLTPEVPFVLTLIDTFSSSLISGIPYTFLWSDSSTESYYANAFVNEEIWVEVWDTSTGCHWVDTFLYCCDTLDFELVHCKINSEKLLSPQSLKLAKGTKEYNETALKDMLGKAYKGLSEKEINDLISDAPCDPCDLDSILVWVIDPNTGLVVGSPQYQFLWSDGSTSDINFAYPDEALWVTIWDPNSCAEPWTDTIFIDCCDPKPPTHLSVNYSAGFAGGWFAHLNWNLDPDATSYVVDIFPNDPSCCKVKEELKPYSFTTTGNSRTLEVTRLCCFSWRVKSVCDSGKESDYTSWICQNDIPGNGCKRDGDSQVIGTVKSGSEESYQNEPSNLEIAIVPNPASDEVSFVVHSHKKIQGVLQLFSSDGVIIKEMKIMDANTKVDISQLAAGVYIFNYTAINGRIINDKLIVK